MGALALARPPEMTARPGGRRLPLASVSQALGNLAANEGDDSDDDDEGDGAAAKAKNVAASQGKKKREPDKRGDVPLKKKVRDEWERANDPEELMNELFRRKPEATGAALAKLDRVESMKDDALERSDDYLKPRLQPRDISDRLEGITVYTVTSGPLREVVFMTEDPVVPDAKMLRDGVSAGGGNATLSRLPGKLALFFMDPEDCRQ